MDQKKTGTFLQSLRKEQGMTQEQLAERFGVSSRTVSRWETGSNMPDVGMLMELADFYHVDIRELIDGERKNGKPGNGSTDALKKVAEYATEKERRERSQVGHIALGITILILVCTILFAGETRGVLYGIVPVPICNGILLCVYGGAVALLVSYLKAILWQEKPETQPEQAVQATVVSKEVRPGTQGAGRSKGGYSYVIHFATEKGQPLELYAYEIEFGGLKEGMSGVLTFRGKYFVSFAECTQGVENN